VNEPRPAPYPSDTRAKGWRFELDYEQIEQSSTWALAGPEARPWLLMLWMTAWKQTPVGTMPNEPLVIAALIGMPTKAWAKHGDVLLRGWWLADDGRLYHQTLAKRVDEMMARRRSDSDRKARERARKLLESAESPTGITPESRVTPTGLPPESSTDNRQPTTSLSSPSGQKEKPARKRAAAPQLVSVEAMVAEGVDAQNAADWLVARKTKDLPLTPTAWQQTKDEAAKAGLTAAEAIKTAAGNGWAGFKASWLLMERRPATSARTPASKHSGFAAKDYREGVTEDGHIA